jgi:hypothetical protein
MKLKRVINSTNKSYAGERRMSGWRWLSGGLITLCAIGLLLTLTRMATAQQLSCPTLGADAALVFPDKSILMRTRLAVNPDGAAASYTPGDHGFTYIQNGVNFLRNGTSISCSARENLAQCRREWTRAEAGGFGAGTPEFCVYAMDVEPIAAGATRVPCGRPRSGRSTVGNGKGRPKVGPAVLAFAGGTVAPYVSITSLRHTREGQPAYVDAAAIPGLVVPTSRTDLLGAIVWVRYDDREGFAIVNDTGPAFGEGSVALHQLLRSGQVGPPQPVGPIPTQLRCSPEEIGLRPPFVSKPDLAGDVCRGGRVAQGPADIRAYQGIDGSVTSIILAKVKPPMNGRVVMQELTTARLGEWAAEAGYTLERLRQMATCLPR